MHPHQRKVQRPVALGLKFHLGHLVGIRCRNVQKKRGGDESGLVGCGISPQSLYFMCMWGWGMEHMHVIVYMLRSEGNFQE